MKPLDLKFVAVATAITVGAFAFYYALALLTVGAAVLIHG